MQPERRQERAKKGQWQAAIAWVAEAGHLDTFQVAERVFASTPIQAEGLAVLTALNAVSQSYSNIVIKSDSQVIQGLLKSSTTKEELKHTVTEIRAATRKVDLVICIKVDRSQVHKAHILAIKCRKYG